jgi:glucose-6-phosphate isomerase
MDLKNISGLPLSLENGKIVLSKEAVSLPASYREPEEAKPYFMDENADFGPARHALQGEAGGADWLYEMVRGVHFEKDKDIFEKKGLRFDITNIKSGVAGKELVKTIGHFHKDSSSEVYEVLSGEAIFLLQEISGNKVFLIKAGPGEKVVIPSGFGHITVNAGKENLILSDISSVDMDPDYEFFKAKKGAAYRAVASENGFKIEKNNNWAEEKELKIGRPKEAPELGIFFSKNLYGSFVENPEKFDFIRNPEKYASVLAPENLFEFSGQ